MAGFDFSFQQIVESARDIVIVTKAGPMDVPGLEIVYVNQAFTQLTGYSFDEAVGQTPRMLQSEKTDPATLEIIRQGLEDRKPVRVIISNRSKYGRDYWLDISMLPLYDENGEVSHFAAIERDVTEQIEREEMLVNQARTDPLTGLLNRRSFNEVLAKEFSRFQRGEDIYSVLMLDVDHFKAINDTYGHAFGDTVLQAISKTCIDNIRLHDTIARIGGEEFCIVSPHAGKETALKVAEKIRGCIEALTLEAAGEYPTLTISIGVSEVRAGDEDYKHAMVRADEALYHAKSTGRNRVCISSLHHLRENASQFNSRA